MSNIRWNKDFSLPNFLTLCSFIIPSSLFIWSWYSLHCMKLADIAKQEAKDQLMFQKLEELSQLFDKSLNSEISVPVADAIPQLSPQISLGVCLFVISLLLFSFSPTNTTTPINIPIDSRNTPIDTRSVPMDAPVTPIAIPVNIRTPLDQFLYLCERGNVNPLYPAMRGDMTLVHITLNTIRDDVVVIKNEQLSLNTKVTDCLSEINSVNTKLDRLVENTVTPPVSTASTSTQTEVDISVDISDLI